MTDKFFKFLCCLINKCQVENINLISCAHSHGCKHDLIMTYGTSNMTSTSTNIVSTKLTYSCHREDKKMIHKIPYQTALKSMFVLLTTILIFHFMIIAGVIPYTIVWGGRLSNSAEMVKFELVSITINAVTLLIMMMKADTIKRIVPNNVLTMLLWGLFYLFVANTFANVFSATLFERVVFTPLTGLYALFTYRIVTQRTPSHAQLSFK